MRKVIGLVFALALVGGAAPGNAAPGVGAGAGQFGFIDWIEMNGSRGTFAGVAADRFVDPDSGLLVTVAGAFKGSCQKEKAGGWTLISCHGTGNGKQIPHEDFSVHPTLDSASLSVTLRGQTHTANWKGLGPAPYTYAATGTDSQWLFGGVSMFRECKGNGRVFGKKHVTNSWMDWAVLDQGAGAAAYTDGDVDVDFRDGRVFIEKTVRIAN
jgi:hypothetical protein